MATVTADASTVQHVALSEDRRSRVFRTVGAQRSRSYACIPHRRVPSALKCVMMMDDTKEKDILN